MNNISATVLTDAGKLTLYDQATWNEVHNCEFQKVFSDGKLYNETSLAEIRARVESYHVKPQEELVGG